MLQLVDKDQKAGKGLRVTGSKYLISGSRLPRPSEIPATRRSAFPRPHAEALSVVSQFGFSSFGFGTGSRSVKAAEDSWAETGLDCQGVFLVGPT